MENPKVSIITICRNEKYIEDTCRSVAEQVYDNFEWIVVDGASTDGVTLEVLERYRDRMSFFVSEPDTGRYNAMNKGIAQARGEYLLFLNGGDFLNDPLVLERLFNCRAESEVLRRNKPKLEGDIIFGEVVARETGLMPWPVWSIGPRTIDAEYLSREGLPHQATFIRRSLFSEIGLYDETYTSAADYEWFMRAILANDATTEYVPLVVSIYNFEGLSSSGGLVSDSIVHEEIKRARAAYAKYMAGISMGRKSKNPFKAIRRWWRKRRRSGVAG